MSKTKKNPEPISKTKLTKTYWLGAHAELGRLGYIQGYDRAKGAVAVYDVLKPLPEQAVLAEEIKALYTKPFSEWYDEARGEVESLQEEIGSWRDNMEGTGLENTSKFSEVSECADQLDNALQALPEEIPEALKDMKVFVSPILLRVSASYRHKKKFRGGPSRAARLDEATGIIETLMDTARQKREDSEEGKQSTKSEELQVALEEFEGELQNVLDEAQSVSFPGMF